MRVCGGWNGVGLQSHIKRTVTPVVRIKAKQRFWPTSYIVQPQKVYSEAFEVPFRGVSRRNYDRRYFFVSQLYL